MRNVRPNQGSQSQTDLAPHVEANHVMHDNKLKKGSFVRLKQFQVLSAKQAKDKR